MLFFLHSSIPLFSLLFLLPACTNKEPAKELEQEHVVDLYASTKIIQKLIVSEKLMDYLEDGTTAEGLEQIVHNFSPARIALEVEILHKPKPAIMLFIDAITAQQYKNIFYNLAEEYFGAINFFIIDVDRLFDLKNQAQVDVVPTVIVIKDRKEHARLEQDITPESLVALLQQFVEM